MQIDSGVGKLMRMERLNKLAKSGRIVKTGNVLRYRRYFDDFPAYPMSKLARYNDIYG